MIKLYVTVVCKLGPIINPSFNEIRASLFIKLGLERKF